MTGIRHETRTETIKRHKDRMFHETRCSEATYGQRVMEEYHARVPALARCVAFKTEGDAFACMALNGQKVSRWFEPEATARLPSDLEEACVYALGGEYTEACRADLAARYDMLAPSGLASASHTDVQVIGNLTADVGAALTALAPLLEDGRITEADKPNIPVALRQIDKLLADATAVRERLRSAAGLGEPLRVVR